MKSGKYALLLCCLMMLNAPSPGANAQDPQSLDTLPQTMSVLFSEPLAEAIRSGRNRVYPHGRPIPKEVRHKLAPFFPRAILNKVRYSTEWDAIGEDTIYHVILGSVAAEAMTLVDVILFRDTQRVSDPLLWAHELTHVEQYTRLGVKTFATRYLQQAWVLETEAITKADAVKAQLSP